MNCIIVLVDVLSWGYENENLSFVLELNRYLKDLYIFIM